MSEIIRIRSEKTCFQYKHPHITLSSVSFCSSIYCCSWKL